MLEVLFLMECCILLKFYIKPQHSVSWNRWPPGCILLKFYIKPQRAGLWMRAELCCILLKFYIKPQQAGGKSLKERVVSY